MKWLSWIGGLCAAALPAQAEADASLAPTATVGQARQWFEQGRRA